jgi:drug/metabolite transporter (DMT)-like permease
LVIGRWELTTDVFVTLALASAACYGAADFLGGIASKRAPTVVIAFVAQLAGLVLLVLVLPLLPAGSPLRSDYLWGAASGVAGGTGVALLYRALAVGTMSIVAPTTAVCAAAVPVVVAFALGERPGALAGVGIVLAAMAIVLLSRGASLDEMPKPQSGIALALMSGVAVGLFFLCLARTSKNAGIWPLIAGRSVSVPLFVAMAAMSRNSVRIERDVAGTAIGCGTLDMLANALYLVATRAGPLSLVATLASLYPASTVLLARVTLGERLSRSQALGVVCALAAVVLIVRSS